jgi:hypothetical protein
MLNRKSIILLGLIGSNLGFAGTMGPVCAPGSVTVPCEAKMWDLGVQALYLQRVTTSGEAYRALPPSNSNTVYDTYKSWDWGYRLEGSYHFNTGNDIDVNWTHFNDYLTRGDLIGTYPATGATPQRFSEINTSYYDQVNVVLGQHADFGLVKKMRFYGGLQYAAIELNKNNYFINSFTIAGPTVVSGQQFDNTEFKGVGPVWGIDYSYDLNSTWSVTANGAASILLGHSKYNNGYLATPAGASSFVIQAVYGSKSLIVPSLEAKLGLNYAYTMPQGTLNVQGGYQAVNYFNALQAQFLQVVGGVRSESYGLFGPYFGVTYVGAA